MVQSTTLAVLFKGVNVILKMYLSYIIYYLKTDLGCAVAQVVSCWPLTVEARTSLCGICSEQSGTGKGLFLSTSFSPVSVLHHCFISFSFIHLSPMLYVKSCQMTASLNDMLQNKD